MRLFASVTNVGISAIITAIMITRPLSAQVESEQLQEERATARFLKSDSVMGKEFAVRSWRFPRLSLGPAGWVAERSERDVGFIAADLGLAIAGEDPIVVECAGAPPTMFCGIASGGNIVTLDAPAIKGDTATIRVSYWTTPPGGLRGGQRWRGPSYGAVYRVVRDKALGWRVDRRLSSWLA